jgi:phasin family protein
MDADTVKPVAEKVKLGAEPPRPDIDASKATVDQITTAANAAFKDGVEKTLAALGEANAHSKKNLEAVVASVSAAAKGAESLSAQAVAYSKSAFETQVNAAKALAAAKTPQEFFELQTAFAKGAFETYVAEMNRMTETFTASFKDSFKPINERVSDVVGKLQATR